MDPYYNALEAMAIEIVDLPSYKKNGVYSLKAMI